MSHASEGEFDFVDAALRLMTDRVLVHVRILAQEEEYVGVELE